VDQDGFIPKPDPTVPFKPFRIRIRHRIRIQLQNPVRIRPKNKVMYPVNYDKVSVNIMGLQEGFNALLYYEFLHKKGSVSNLTTLQYTISLIHKFINFLCQKGLLQSWVWKGSTPDPNPHSRPTHYGLGQIGFTTLVR